MADRVFPLKIERISSGGSQNDKHQTKFNSKEDTIPLYRELLLVSDETNVFTDTIQQGVKVDSAHNILLFDRHLGDRLLSSIIPKVSQNPNYSEIQGTTYSTRDSITFSGLKAGDYLINYTFYIGINSSDYNFIFDVLVNSVSIFSADRVIVLPDSQMEYLPIQSFYKYTLSADGDIDIDFKYKSNNASGVAKVDFSAYSIVRV